ncbi:MAG: homocysteine methyltransferase, partial [Clostridiales bacterium]|nr:homocysteine methyltransferase [Clostridiales bacterium]
GVDLILEETMNDLYEAKAAVLAAKASGLPVVLTTAYDSTHKLLTGADPKAVVAVAEGLDVDAVGVNCSLGPDQMLPIVDELVEYASVPVVVNPNAGLPRSEHGRTVYDVGPEDFARTMRVIAQKGAHGLGGCCGTTPDHIRALVGAVSDLRPVPFSEKERTLVASFTHAVEFGRRPVLIGERINPTGKKRLKEALRTNDLSYILGQGVTQQEQGADVLDVNVGLPEIDEPAMMRAVVDELQSVTDLPLQIDTTNVEAMETALRRVNGKAMINSVNGKEEVMRAVFPLAKKYGGLVVALTIDESGIPETAQGRVDVARRIIARAGEYGIKKKDIIVDPLAMSISADPGAAMVTLEAVRRIREELGVMTSLGVSNISFGLPQRDMINGTFFAMALADGLDAAIMNPGSAEMMKAYRACLALRGMDEHCEGYIAFAERCAPLAQGAANAPAQAKQAAPGIAREPALEPLAGAIVKGLRQRAAEEAEALLGAGRASIDLIDGALIPALDFVGKGFEENTVFLPQLLMSAEAAAAAFDAIREALSRSGAVQQIRGRVVLATVQGDIHDIGKNIVKVLLQNYGFEVIDLGRDVPPETVVETVLSEGIRLVGLSALMTTTVPAMEATIKLLREKAPECKVCVGGAVLNREYAESIGADRYCRDAMETVRYAEEVSNEE